jgi:hypothetical protein
MDIDIDIVPYTPCSESQKNTQPGTERLGDGTSLDLPRTRIDEQSEEHQHRYALTKPRNVQQLISKSGFSQPLLSFFRGSINGGAPNFHPFIDGFSLINHPAIGVPQSMETPTGQTQCSRSNAAAEVAKANTSPKNCML